MTIDQIPNEVACRLDEVEQLRGCYVPLLSSVMPPPPYGVIFEWLLELVHNHVPDQEWLNAVQHSRHSLGMMIQLQTPRLQ